MDQWVMFFMDKNEDVNLNLQNGSVCVCVCVCVSEVFKNSYCLNQYLTM